MNLTKSAPYTIGALTLALTTTPLGAQTVRVLQPSQEAQANAQLAFGYACDDKFALRNDGAMPVSVEYAIAGTDERGMVDVRAGETVELESASPNDVQLFLDGRLVASEPKGYRPCDDDWASGRVMVRRLETRAVVYALPTRVVYVRPWMGGYMRGPVVRIGWGGFSVSVNGGRGYDRDVRPPMRRDDDDRYEYARDRRGRDEAMRRESNRPPQRNATPPRVATPRGYQGQAAPPRAEPGRSQNGASGRSRDGAAGRAPAPQSGTSHRGGNDGRNDNGRERGRGQRP